MASADLDSPSTSDKILSELKQCRKEIKEQFSDLQEILIRRQEKLLSELDAIERKYKTSKFEKDHLIRLEAFLKDQKACLDYMEGYSTQARSSLLKNIKQTELDQSSILENQEYLTEISFKFDDKPILNCIKSLGELVTSNRAVIQSANYENRGTPQVLQSKKGKRKGQLHDPTGIVLDSNDNIYISDINNNKIIVFTINGEYIREFGKDNLNTPHYLCICKDHVYVTNLGSRFSVVKFHIDGDYITNSTMDNDQVNSSYGIDADSNNGLLYICDNYTSRVTVLDEDLQFKKSIKLDKLQYFKDAKITGNTIYALTHYAVHIYSMDGDFIRTLTHKFNHALHLILDNFGYILVSDCDDNSIVVISLNDETKKYTLGTELQDNNLPYCKSTRGIALSRDNKIVNVCYDDNTRLQIL